MKPTANSSIRLYYEMYHHRATTLAERVEVPTGIAVFRDELPAPQRSLAERLYNLHRWAEMQVEGTSPL